MTVLTKKIETNQYTMKFDYTERAGAFRIVFELENPISLNDAENVILAVKNKIKRKKTKSIVGKIKV